MLVAFGLCFKQHFDTMYLAFCNLPPTRMFFPLDFLSEYRIQHGTVGPFMSHLATQISYSTGEFRALQLIVFVAFGVVD